jgi:hypothetical protein
LQFLALTGVDRLVGESDFGVSIVGDSFEGLASESFLDGFVVVVHIFKNYKKGVSPRVYQTPTAQRANCRLKWNTRIVPLRENRSSTSTESHFRTFTRQHKSFCAENGSVVKT